MTEAPKSMRDESQGASTEPPRLLMKLIWAGVLIVAAGLMVILIMLAFGRKAAVEAYRGRGASRPALVATPINDPGTPDPKVVRKIADFKLQDRTGGQISLEDLRGKVWIASFIFTRCKGTCPAITMRMYDLQRKLEKHSKRNDIRLVSFTVDPAFDTPTILAEYAESWKANDDWLFLTGPDQPLRQLIEKSFLLPVQLAPQNSKEPIIHSQNLVLVDQQGRHRGFYQATNQKAPDGTVLPNQIKQLLQDIDKVLKESQESENRK